jgi:hypothetical protein
MKMQQIKDESKAKDTDLSSDCKNDGTSEIYLMDEYNRFICFELTRLLFVK